MGWFATKQNVELRSAGGGFRIVNEDGEDVYFDTDKYALLAWAKENGMCVTNEWMVEHLTPYPIKGDQHD